MNIINRSLKNIMLVLMMTSLLFAACDKPKHPVLGDYLKTPILPVAH